MYQDLQDDRYSRYNGVCEYLDGSFVAHSR